MTRKLRKLEKDEKIKNKNHIFLVTDSRRKATYHMTFLHRKGRLTVLLRKMGHDLSATERLTDTVSVAI